MSLTHDTPVIAIIPLRRGSKGLEGKNTKILNGKPLYRWTLNAALEAGVDSVLISTNIPSVLGSDLPKGTLLRERPEQLCSDDATMDDVLKFHILEDKMFAQNVIVVLLQATSPLRNSTHVEEALTIFRTTDCELLMSVTQVSNKALKSGTVSGGRFTPIRRHEDLFANRQNLPDLYAPNGSIYIFTSDDFRRNGSLSGHTIATYIMDRLTSIDIDTEEDLLLIKEVMNGYEKPENVK